MPAGLFAHTVRLVRPLLTSYGVAPEPVLTAAGIDPADLSDPVRPLAAEAVERLWISLPEVTGDACVGLRAADFLHPSHLGALGYAWLASATLRRGLNRWSRYVRIVADHRKVWLVDGADEVHLMSVYLGPATSATARSDAASAALVKMCRWNFGEHFTPRRLDLQRPRPVSTGRHEAYFRCPIRFGADHDCMVLSAIEADFQLTGGNPEFAKLSESVIEDYLKLLGDDELTGRVKAQIVAQLPCGEVRIDRAALALHLSVRTLQRRLGERGTTFREQVEATRRELAEYHLRDSSLTITEVAFRTGFSDMSSFSKAVRQWTGLAPSQYRELLAGAP